MRYFHFLFFIMLTLSAGAIDGISPVGTLNIKREINPPILSIVQGSIVFHDSTNNQMIDAEEKCYISFDVLNSGRGDALGCIAKLSATGAVQGLYFSPSMHIERIPAGTKKRITLPITASDNTTTGKVTFAFHIDEPQGFGTDNQELVVGTRQFVNPFLQVVDFVVTGDRGGILQKKMPFNLQLLLQNTQHGTAEDVVVQLKLPKNVLCIDGNDLQSFANLNAGKTLSLDYGLIVNNNYSDNTIPIQVIIKERYGKFSENKTITLQLNQALASSRLSVESTVNEPSSSIEIASIRSEVDRNIPKTNKKSPKTFALIIANENYENVARVPYAINDGTVFSDYCQQTLGIPASNIHLVTDATSGNMRKEINWLKQVMEAFDGESKIIFYYAGHGVPSENDKTAYLLPVDGDANDLSVSYNLDRLFSTLGNIPARSITIFLDACFSGARRDNGDGMLYAARGTALKAKSGRPVGNMVVLSAATGNQTAYPSDPQKHGMFTYFLLKKLQDSQGNATLEEIRDYVQKNVQQQSLVQNGKSQTPSLVAAPAVSEAWKKWTLN